MAVEVRVGGGLPVDPVVNIGQGNVGFAVPPGRRKEERRAARRTEASRGVGFGFESTELFFTRNPPSSARIVTVTTADARTERRSSRGSASRGDGWSWRATGPRWEIRGSTREFRPAPVNHRAPISLRGTFGSPELTRNGTFGELKSAYIPLSTRHLA